MCFRFKLKVILLVLGAAGSAKECVADLAAPRYIAYEIGTFGGPGSRAVGVNDHGMVVGMADTERELGFNAFVYTIPDGLRGLGLLESSTAIAVNNAGRIVGSTSGTPGGSSFAYVMDEATRVVQPIGPVTAALSQAYAINEAGHVTGDSFDSPNNVQALYYRDGELRDIGELGGIATRAFGLSNTGWVTGMSDTVSGETRAFLYSETAGMRDLGTLGGTFGGGWGVNDQGHVAGRSTLANGEHRAFVHDGETMVSLGTLGGDFSAAFDINNDGLVVGGAAGPSGVRAFLHEGGVMMDLNLLTDFSGTDFAWLTFALDISETGYIVGEGTLTTGETRGFLLVPTAIPEPGNIAFLGGVFAALWTASRRRRRLGGNHEL